MSEDGTPLGAAVLLDAALVVVAILAAASLARVTSLLAALPVPFWSLGLYLDMSSTRDIHRLDPGRFDRNELNKVIAGLVDRFGFTPGAILYVFLWEIPVFIFVSLFVLRFVAPFPSLLPGLAPRLGGAATAMGATHSTAWYRNRECLESRRQIG